MSCSNSTRVFGTPFVLLDDSIAGQKAFLDMAKEYLPDDWSNFAFERCPDGICFSMDHVNSFEAFESFNLGLSEFANAISPLIGSAFKFTIRNLDTGDDERDEVIYAGPTPESIERFVKHDLVARAVDVLKQGGASSLKKFVDLLEGSLNSELQDFVVEIIEEDGTDVIRFECAAEDEMHAREKVLSSHPDIRVVNVFLKSGEFDLSDDELVDDLVRRATEAGFEILQDSDAPGQWIWWHADSATASNTLPTDPIHTSREAAARAALQCEAADHVTIELSLSVDYKLNGESPKTMQSNLERAVERAFGEGLLTGSTAAVVAQHSMEVQIRPNLTEDELADFMEDRIENAQISFNDLPRRMARYGLMAPAAFVQEMDERMRDIEFGRYADDDVASADTPSS